MPTYEYRCKACGEHLEIFQSITERPKRKCPLCEKKGLERLISSGSGIIFKGSGFYETDYRSKSYQEGARKDSSASSTAKSSSSSSSTTKDSSTSKDKVVKKDTASKGDKKMKEAG